MRSYLVKITMADGSVGRHHGLYTDGCAAILTALEVFPGARRISAERCA